MPVRILFRKFQRERKDGEPVLGKELESYLESFKGVIVGMSLTTAIWLESYLESFKVVSSSLTLRSVDS